MTRARGQGHGAWDAALEALLDALGLSGAAREAARAFESRASDPRHADVLTAAFEG
ncbi:hypothetical protein D3C83_210910 [compost metagenome]